MILALIDFLLKVLTPKRQRILAKGYKDSKKKIHKLDTYPFVDLLDNRDISKAVRTHL